MTEVELLEGSGWTAPEADGYPTCDELVERYLEPLAAVPRIAAALEQAWLLTCTQVRVRGLARRR